ncbi:MAG: tetratricopeptide repeat protein, partial [bacterium]|nr:tetratricopeptide repeat protein [bacterium]
LKLKPDNNDAWFSKGLTYKIMGRYDESLASMAKALELYSDDGEVSLEKAKVHLLKNQAKEALNSIAKAIEADDDLKETAKSDEELQALWESAEFKKLVS